MAEPTEETDSCPSCGLKDTDDSRGGHWRVWIGILADFGGCKSCEWAPEKPSAAEISRAYGGLSDQMIGLEQKFIRTISLLDTATSSLSQARGLLWTEEKNDD